MFPRAARPCRAAAAGSLLMAALATASAPVRAAEPPSPDGAPPPLAVNTEVPPRPVKDDKGILTFQLENDLFLGTDRHYTNGVRLAYLSAEDAVPAWIERPARALPIFPDAGNLRVSYAIGQSMFTPRDITVAAPQPDERPWAGFSWASIGLINDAGNRLDNLELTVGVVGPASHAEETQKLVHRLVGSPKPRGWDNQLHNEPIVTLAYERTWRGWAESEYLGLEVDATPHVGGSVGNAFTHASAGLTLRFGDDLPADYGAPRIRPSMPGSDFFVPQQDFAWYVFAGMDGRAVLRDITLDGNTFRDSPSVDRKWLVGEVQAGLALTIQGVRLAYTHVFRTREFEQQDAPDQFGAFSISVRF